MNIIDIIIVCCCVPAVIHGLSKGFVSQAFSLVALILGVWLSFKFSNAVGEWLVTYIDLPSTVIHVIAFALIMLVVMLITHLAGKAVEGVLKVVMLGWLNKLLGIVFALLKAVLIIGLVIILFEAINNTFPIVPSKTMEESIFYGPVKDLANLIFPYLKELIFKK
ncbi:MAG: CvpA family protein [Bacteroidales bacterium]|nr:CvpA family protein [Bacteroidales bacterium]MBR3441300.1 CvpA family protein [Bacteroidales bacterium]